MSLNRYRNEINRTWNEFVAQSQKRPVNGVESCSPVRRREWVLPTGGRTCRLWSERVKPHGDIVDLSLSTRAEVHLIGLLSLWLKYVAGIQVNTAYPPKASISWIPRFHLTSCHVHVKLHAFHIMVDTLQNQLGTFKIRLITIPSKTTAFHIKFSGIHYHYLEKFIVHLFEKANTVFGTPGYRGVFEETLLDSVL